jgi:hypothetical protein
MRAAQASRHGRWHADSPGARRSREAAGKHDGAYGRFHDQQADQ